LQRILYFLVLCIGLSANLLGFAGKDSVLGYGDLSLGPAKAKMVIHLFEEDFKTEKLFTNPQAFSTPKTLERVEFESAELLAKRGKELLFQWGESERADEDLLLQGTLTLFQAAQFGSPEARRWMSNIYDTFYSYYYYKQNNPDLATIYHEQKRKLFSDPMNKRWEEARQKFGSGKTEPSRVIAPGVLVLQPGQQAPKVSKRLESIDGRSLSDATRQAQEDERAATEYTPFLAPAAKEGEHSSCMDIPPLQSLVDAAARLASRAHPKQE
jgi:hypothetical protein